MTQHNQHPEPAAPAAEVYAITDADALRFLSKLAEPDSNGCRRWTAYVNADGYGDFTLGGRTVSSHRVAYVLAHGSLPAPGLVLDHLCRVRACAEPSHLEPVTQAENLRRGKLAESNRARKAARATCRRGHDLTDPANVHEDSSGYRRCKACRVTSRAAYEASENAGRLRSDRQAAGLCPAGRHARDVVGQDPDGNCSECRRERSRHWRAQRRRVTLESGPTHRVVLAQHRADGLCSSGRHVYAEVGQRDGGSCVACRRSYLSHRRAVAVLGDRFPSATVTRADVWEVFLHGGRCCAWCGDAVSWDAVHFDHVQPLELGGDHAPWAIVPSCQPCNRLRSAQALPWVAFDPFAVLVDPVPPAPFGWLPVWLPDGSVRVGSDVLQATEAAA